MMSVYLGSISFRAHHNSINLRTPGNIPKHLTCELELLLIYRTAPNHVTSTGLLGGLHNNLQLRKGFK